MRFSTLLNTALFAFLISSFNVHAFDLGDLANLVGSGADTPEKILNRLPEGMRSNATFVYNSRSLQQASTSHPRVLLWDDATGFSLSYNGDPKLRGYSTLEMASLNRASGVLGFYELKFPLRRDTAGRAFFQPSQPQTCLACHGPNPRPIWGAFPRWPGVYGSFNDRIEGAELEALQTFSDVAKKEPRYRPIILPKTSEALPATPTALLADRPNFRYGALLSRINAYRLRKLIETPDPKRRRAILLFFTGCELDFETPSDVTSTLDSMNLSLADLDLRTVYYDPKNNDLDFYGSYPDGFSTTRELLIYQLVKDWMPGFEGLEQITRTIEDSLPLADRKDSRSREMIKDLDSWGPWIALDGSPPLQKLCDEISAMPRRLKSHST
jgi:hypothetical protein